MFCECLTNEPALTKDADGVWSVTVGPLEPDIYEYHFTVDGIDNLDQRNPVVKYNSRPNLIESVRRRSRAVADVLRREAGSARHGRTSNTTRRRRRARPGARFVYTPPNYERSTAGFRCSISCTAPTATKPRGRSSAART